VPHLSVALLGPIQASLDGEPVSGFETLKARALLAYLADDPGRPHSRSTLACLLWPERSESAALNNLRHTLAVLRATLHDRQACPPFLLADRETIAFNPCNDCTIDTLDFRHFMVVAQGAGAPASEQLDCLEQAAALYRGDFLEAFALDDSVALPEWLFAASAGLASLWMLNFRPRPWRSPLAPPNERHRQLWAALMGVSLLYLLVGSFWFQHWYLLWVLVPAVLLPDHPLTRSLLPWLVYGALSANLVMDFLAASALKPAPLHAYVLAVVIIWGPALVAWLFIAARHRMDRL
jgi:hypothetical protein